MKPAEDDKSHWPIPGEFIEVPAWKTFGQVLEIEHSHYGPDGSIRVLLREHPEQRVRDCKWYHLEPDQFSFT